MEEILDAAPREQNRRVLHNVSFVRATFEADVDFREVDFKGDSDFGQSDFRAGVWFDRATFIGRANFIGTSFRRIASFFAVKFQHDASFNLAQFHDAGFGVSHFTGKAQFHSAQFRTARFMDAEFAGEAGFAGARISGDADYRSTTFKSNVWFDKARFRGPVDFHSARFMQYAGFKQVQFRQNTWFTDASFDGVAYMGEASFQSDVSFQRASFDQPEIGPVPVSGLLLMAQVRFAQAVRLKIAADRLSLEGCLFHGGGHINVATAEISLAEAEISAPLIISPLSSAEHVSNRWPALVSVQRADVAGLVVTGIDLAPCHFAEAHHLDQLRITGGDSLRRIGGRQVLAEECQWRRRAAPYLHRQYGFIGRMLSDRIRSYSEKKWGPTESLDRSPLLSGSVQPGPAMLVGLYRDLRRGREEAKNEPGAADFYYGECEMRRHAPSTPRAEKLLLTLYWLVSGYGLRAWRALMTLAVLLLILSFGFWQIGFGEHHPSYWAGLTYSALSTLSMDSKAKVLDDDLTLPGDLLRLTLRLTGPVLFALALLSVRNRVKR